MFAAGTGERGAPALGIDDAQLPQPPVGVGLGEGVDGFPGRLALGQAFETFRPVIDVGVRLGGHRTDAGLGHGTTLPTAKNLLCTATPRSPVFGS